jgi:hypothetical protein
MPLLLKEQMTMYFSMSAALTASNRRIMMETMNGFLTPNYFMSIFFINFAIQSGVFVRSHFAGCDKNQIEK